VPSHRHPARLVRIQRVMTQAHLVWKQLLPLESADVINGHLPRPDRSCLQAKPGRGMAGHNDVLPMPVRALTIRRILSLPACPGVRYIRAPVLS
jgi:hypothetical protein